MKTTFTGDEFVKALSEGNLKRPLILTGMVKKSDEPNVILFTPGTFCQNWVPIKASCIDEVKWLGNVSCRDHSHEYVSIDLKGINEVEPTLFVDLLKVYVEAYEISGTSQLVPQATANVHPTTGFVGDPSKSVYSSSQTVRGCYYGVAASYDCNLAGFEGVRNGWWRGFTCNYPSVYCNSSGFALITNP